MERTIKLFVVLTYLYLQDHSITIAVYKGLTKWTIYYQLLFVDDITVVKS